MDNSLRNNENKVPKWKDMSPVQKIATAVAAAGIGLWAVLLILSRLRPELAGINITYPSLVLVTLCEAVVHWSVNRKIAHLYLASAVILAVCFLL